METRTRLSWKGGEDEFSFLEPGRAQQQTLTSARWSPEVRVRVLTGSSSCQRSSSVDVDLCPCTRAVILLSVWGLVFLQGPGHAGPGPQP